MKYRLLLLLLFWSVFWSVVAVVNENLVREVKNMKKDIRRKEKLSKSNEKEENTVSLAILYFHLGTKIQEGWLSKDLPGSIITEALDSYDKAIHYSQSSLTVLLPIILSKGILLRMMGRGEEALSAYENALNFSLYPIDRAAFEYNRADTLVMMGKVREALPFFEASIRRIPCKVERYYGYVNSLKEINEWSREQWLDLLKRLQKIERRCVKSKPIIDEVDDEDNLEEDGYEDDEPFIYPKKSLLFQDVSQGLMPQKLSDFYYSLFLVNERLGNLDHAWTYLQAGKRVEKQNRSNRFNRHEAIANLNSTRLIFTTEMMHSYPNLEGIASTVPIFIIGMMRSGSTLLETMLDNHPAIWGMGEDSLFNANLTALRDRIVHIASSSSSGAAGVNRLEASQQLEEVLLDYGDHTVKQMKATAERLYYVSKAQELGQLKYFVDKMLFNYKNVPFLHLVYPEAAILHIIRDPLDTLWSCYRNKFDDAGLEWTLDVKDLVLQYVLYLEYMHHYRQLLPNRMIEIRYEALVHSPEKILKKVLHKLELSFDERLLAFHESARRVQTNSQSQVRQKLYTHSIGQWRKYGIYLEELRQEFLRYLPYLKDNQMLPFPNHMNWEMRSDYNYSRMAATPSKKSQSMGDHRSPKQDL